MDIKDAKTANDVAKLAESLADRVEAGIPDHDTRASYEAAALLFGDGMQVHKSGELLVDRGGNPAQIIGVSYGGILRGRLPSRFGRDIVHSIELAERIFPGWGWDVIKWPLGQGGVPAGVKVVDGIPGELPEGAFVYDAEVTPPEDVAKAAAGRPLVGQHTTAGGALLAAILRGYAFKVKHEAGALEAPIDFGLTDEERGFVADIVDRAEELELLPPEARVDRMMDIAAVHKNGCPLDLESFLHHATDFSFKHDFLGIVENIDRSTGKLQNHFLPKYAQAETDRIVAEGAAAQPIVGVDNGAADGDATVRGLVEDGKFTILQTDYREPGLADELARDFGNDKPKSEG